VINDDLTLYHPNIAIGSQEIRLEDFIEAAEYTYDIVRTLRAESVPWRIHPESNGAIPVGVTTYGHNVLLLPTGTGAEDWVVLVDWRHYWHRYELGFGEFLVQALAGQLQPDFFGEARFEKGYRMLGIRE
jgi:hypothetical protein